MTFRNLIQFKSLYFLSLAAIIGVIASFATGTLQAIPFALAIYLFWVVQDEVKNRKLKWIGVLLHALFLSVMFVVIIAIFSDKWIDFLAYILAGSFLFALDNKIRHLRSKRITLVSDIVGYALIAGVIIYWYCNKGPDAGLIGFTAGLVIKGITEFRESYGKNNLNQAIDTSPNA